MKIFEMAFFAETIDNSTNELGCDLKLSGDADKIGMMFGRYAVEQMKRGQPEPIRVLIHAFEQVQKDSGNKILSPTN